MVLILQEISIRRLRNCFSEPSVVSSLRFAPKFFLLWFPAPPPPPSLSRCFSGDCFPLVRRFPPTSFLSPFFFSLDLALSAALSSGKEWWWWGALLLNVVGPSTGQVCLGAWPAAPFLSCPPSVPPWAGLGHWERGESSGFGLDAGCGKPFGPPDMCAEAREPTVGLACTPHSTGTRAGWGGESEPLQDALPLSGRLSLSL